MAAVISIESRNNSYQRITYRLYISCETRTSSPQPGMSGNRVTVIDSAHSNYVEPLVSESHWNRPEIKEDPHNGEEIWEDIEHADCEGELPPMAADCIYPENLEYWYIGYAVYQHASDHPNSLDTYSWLPGYAARQRHCRQSQASNSYSVREGRSGEISRGFRSPDIPLRIEHETLLPHNAVLCS